MSELQTLKRTRQDATVPNVQGRLILRFPDDENGHDEGGFGLPTFRAEESGGLRSGRRRPTSRSKGVRVSEERPPTYRQVVATWTDDWREKWGLRANELEETGLAWRDAETQAFVEILNRIREATTIFTPATTELQGRSGCAAGLHDPGFLHQDAACHLIESH